MATDYLVKGSVTLEPVIANQSPQVTVAVPDQAVTLRLDETVRIPFTFTASDRGWIQIDFINKDYAETAAGRDMAVIVREIEFFNVSDPRFVWQGVYRPCYPEPWLSQQPVAPEPELRLHDYLGWNGTWRLDFDLPVFTWMHQVLGLGWIYC